MKRIYIETSWPETWKYSYLFDLQEIWGEVKQRGYTYGYHNRRNKAIALIQEVLPPGSTVLDVAAAQGNFSLALAEVGYKVTWNDLREDLAEYVKQKYEFGEINFVPGNVFDLDFPYQFDCVLITEIIEHVAHPDQFLSSIANLVKPGGYIVMSTPNGAYFRNSLPKFSQCDDPSKFESIQFAPNSDGHIFLLWPEEIVWLANQSGLILEKHEVFTNPLTAGHIKLELALKFLPESFVMDLENITQSLPPSIKKKITTSSVSRFRKKSD
jgi:2-polyprenyl-6-hydroxyphenyl methylase/3-demethylubiquinone-9 3-methyltransferase